MDFASTGGRRSIAAAAVYGKNARHKISRIAATILQRRV